MNEQFEVGEVAIFWRPDSPNHRMEVTVTGPLVTVNGVDSITGRLEIVEAYQVSVPPEWDRGGYATSDEVHIRPIRLRKRRPPQELGSWDDCAWKPKHMQKLLTFSPKKQVPA